MAAAEAVVFLVLVVSITAITSATVFCVLWLLWLRRLQRRLDIFPSSLFANLLQSRSPLQDPEVVRTRPPTGEVELVARIRVAAGAKTVSVVESGGRRYLRVEGELSRQERDHVLRYLRAEGFMD